MKFTRRQKKEDKQRRKTGRRGKELRGLNYVLDCLDPFSYVLQLFFFHLFSTSFPSSLLLLFLFLSFAYSVTSTLVFHVFVIIIGSFNILPILNFFKNISPFSCSKYKCLPSFSLYFLSLPSIIFTSPSFPF